MTIIQVDAPLHDLEDWTVHDASGPHSPHAAGYLDGHPVTIRRLLEGGLGGLLAQPRYRATLFGYGPAPIHADVPTFDAAVALAEAAVYYHDPAVAFMIAAGGSYGAAEVLAS